MVAAADVKNDGIVRIVSSAVGVLSADASHIELEPELRMHTWRNGHVITESIAFLHNMIKSRSFAVGDIDGDGLSEVVVGTRALGEAPSIETLLLAYRFDATSSQWIAETLDRSGPLGFHAVAVADVDGNGTLHVIASDDGAGRVSVYRRGDSGWNRQVIYSSDGAIFCSGIHLIDPVLEAGQQLSASAAR
jgi:hypothetical protein